MKGSEEIPAIESALRDAATEQTTLNVDTAALEAAVSSEPAVRGISASPDFPHGLTIDVDLREPAGYLKSVGVIAGDGVILSREGHSPGDLATIEVAGGTRSAGGRVEGAALHVATVLGAAPSPLSPLVRSATVDPDFGVVVELDDGLDLRFGGPGSASQKWQAAAAVLADPDLEGAAYLDLSVPERPVAGGVPSTSQEAGTEASAPTAPTVPETAVASDAAEPVDPAVDPAATEPVEPVETGPPEAAPATAESGGTTLG